MSEIEAGEYVRLKYGKIDKVKNNDYYIQQYNGKVHTQDDIKTILTKEQYNQNCYRLEG